MSTRPDGEAARLLRHAEHVAAVVHGDSDAPGKVPPRSVYRSNAAGRRAWLAKLGEAVEADLARYDDPAEE